MVAATRVYRTIENLMDEQDIDLDNLVQRTGLEPRIVAAIAQERYTPSPEQRERMSKALRFPRDRIVWGHRYTSDESVYPRL